VPDRRRVTQSRSANGRHGGAGLRGLAGPPRLTGLPVEGKVEALGFGLNPYAAAVVGMLTGVGGGVLRDVLAGEIPSVFRRGSRLYVIPALLGGGITAALWSLGRSSLLAMVLVAAAVTAVRIASLRFRWRAASPLDVDVDD